MVLKTTTMSIINGLNKPYTGHVVLRKKKMAFSQNNDLQDNHRGKYFCSDNETLKVIFKTMEQKTSVMPYKTPGIIAPD
jgi:ATPase subunit of ABC transporter with duplicated ATPase domains